MITVDQPFYGQRRSEIKNNFTVPEHLQLANFVDEFDKNNLDASRIKFVQDSFNDGLTWKDVQWLIGFTKLPVIVKGILSPADALIAADVGCSGIIVSNHGARQLDTVMATVCVYIFCQTIEVLILC